MPSPNAEAPVAFLGLGIMGRPMARHLASAGIPLRVWNRTAPAPDAFKDFPQVEVCASASQAMRSARIVIVMLSSGAVVDEVLFAQDCEGKYAAQALEGSSLVIVMSSIPVDTARAQAGRLGAMGLRYIDAPVSGGERGAQAASLTIMAGGNANDVEDAMPVLRLLGNVTHVGPAGAGQIAKLANQLIVGVTIGAVAEALILAAAAGADIPRVCQALQGGFADSAVLRQHGERMVNRAFDPGGHASTQLKDLATAQQLAALHGLELPFLKLAEQLYGSMCDHGLSERDHSALYLEIERMGRGPAAH